MPNMTLNQADAPNAAMALWLHSERKHRGVGDQRSLNTHKTVSFR